MRRVFFLPFFCSLSTSISIPSYVRVNVTFQMILKKWVPTDFKTALIKRLFNDFIIQIFFTCQIAILSLLKRMGMGNRMIYDTFYHRDISWNVWFDLFILFKFWSSILVLGWLKLKLKVNSKFGVRNISGERNLKKTFSGSIHYFFVPYILIIPYNSWRASGSKAEKPCFRGSCSAAYNTINYRCRQCLAKEKMCAQADRLWWCGNAEANGRKPV